MVRPGVRALREIRKYQKSTSLLLPKLPFSRVVREVVHGYRDDLRMNSLSLDALQEVTEMYLVRLMEDAQMAAIHDKRITVKSKDVELATKLHKRKAVVPGVEFGGTFHSTSKKKKTSAKTQKQPVAVASVAQPRLPAFGVRPFSAAELAEITRVQNDNMFRKVEFCKQYCGAGEQGLMIEERSMACLKPLEWLNSNVVAAYMCLLKKRSLTTKGMPSAMYIDPSVPQSLVEATPHQLQNASFVGRVRQNLFKTNKRVDSLWPGKTMLDMDWVFQPLGTGTHWLLIAISPKLHQIRVYDSIGRMGHNKARLVIPFLIEAMQQTYQSVHKHADPVQWSTHFCEAQSPQQDNGCDCGVFTCMVADSLSRGIDQGVNTPIAFNSMHVLWARRYMTLSILRETLL